MSKKYKSVLKKPRQKRIKKKEELTPIINANLVLPPGRIETPDDLLHIVKNFNHAHLDLMQEVASQAMGGRPTVMYGQFVDPSQVPEDVVTLALADVKKVETVIKMVNALRKESRIHPSGGGFFRAIKWVLDSTRHFGSELMHQIQMGTLKKDEISSRTKGTINSIEEMARIIDTVVGQQFDFNNKTALARTSRTRIVEDLIESKESTNKQKAQVVAKEPRVDKDELMDTVDMVQAE